MQDWKGTKESVFKTMGASSHCKEERQNEDFYATDPKAIDILLSVEKFDGNIWEPCCGQGHLSKRLTDLGQRVVSTDLIERGFGNSGVDFLKSTECLADNIITNPPYSMAQEFVEHAMSILQDGGKLAMFLKILFLEGKKRKEMFKNYPIKTLYVSSSRIHCAKNGDFSKSKEIGSAMAYGWFVWEKGYKGETVVRWVN